MIPAHYMIHVRDLHRAVAFYEEALGFTVADRHTYPGTRLVYMRVPGARFELADRSPPAAQPGDAYERFLTAFRQRPDPAFQEAALFGLQRLAAWREEKRRMMLERLEALRAAFRANAIEYRLISAGAFFAWVRHPFQAPAAAVARRLADRHNLLCLPGTYFGPGQDQALRLAFANLPAEKMEEVARRLRASQEDTR